MLRQRRFIVLISAGPHQPDVPGSDWNHVQGDQPSAISAPQNRQSMAAKHHMPVPRIALGLSSTTTGARSAVLARWSSLLGTPDMVSAEPP